MRRIAMWMLLLATGLAPARADTVRMAFGDNLAPYALPQADAGIEVELVRAALAYRGHVLDAQYLPMGRIAASFKLRQVDAIMLDVGEDMTAQGGYYGAPPVLYDNVFYTLKRRGLAIRRPDDLKLLTVQAFVGAAKRYPDWLGGIARSQSYTENNFQEAQPFLLAQGRYDAVLSDRVIFQYFVLQQKKHNPGFVMPEVVAHPFIQPNPRDYRPVFRDAAIRDDFNAGLAWLRKSGREQAIYDKYLKN